MNTLDVIKSRLDITGKKISGLENIAVVTIHNE